MNKKLYSNATSQRQMLGLKQRPTYDDMIKYISDDPDKILFPNRKAKIVRNSFQLSQLDGIGTLEINRQHEQVLLNQQRQILLKRFAQDYDLPLGDVTAYLDNLGLYPLHENDARNYLDKRGGGANIPPPRNGGMDGYSQPATDQPPPHPSPPDVSFSDDQPYAPQIIITSSGDVPMAHSSDQQAPPTSMQNLGGVGLYPAPPLHTPSSSSGLVVRDPRGRDRLSPYLRDTPVVPPHVVAQVLFNRPNAVQSNYVFVATHQLSGPLTTGALGSTDQTREARTQMVAMSDAVIQDSMRQQNMAQTAQQASADLNVVAGVAPAQASSSSSSSSSTAITIQPPPTAQPLQNTTTTPSTGTARRRVSSKTRRFDFVPDMPSIVTAMIAHEEAQAQAAPKAKQQPRRKKNEVQEPPPKEAKTPTPKKRADSLKM